MGRRLYDQERIVQEYFEEAASCLERNFVNLCFSSSDADLMATANAVKLAGATPVLVDVNAQSFDFDLEKLERRITPKTKAIIPVHVNGRGRNIRSLMKIADQHRLSVVEDAAEALGSKMGGQQLGTFGHIGCFSFSPNKIITTGQGGMLVTSDSKLHQRLLELKDQGRPVRGTGGADEHVSIGYNFKLTNVQAAIGIAQLEKLEERMTHIHELASLYSQHLSEIIGGSGLSIYGAVLGATLGVWIYSRVSKFNFGHFTDLMAPGVILAQATSLNLFEEIIH